MIRPLSRMSAFLYGHIAKPALFLLPPDRAHSGMVILGRIVQRSRLFMRTLHKIWAYNDPILAQTIYGIKFVNPVGLSAGFDKNIQLGRLMQTIGFGYMEGGTVTLGACRGNARPWFYRLPHSKALVVHSGLANHGIPLIKRHLEKEKVFDSFPLNISVAQTNSKRISTLSNAIDDCIEGLILLENVGAMKMATINISCPNTVGGEPFTEPVALEALLSRVDALHLRVPLFLKMPSSLAWLQFSKLLAVADRHSVAGVTIANLIKDRRLIDRRDRLPNSVMGGISGRPTFETSNLLIRKTYERYSDRFTIIGVGGIFSADDAYQKIRLGASLVALVTGVIFRGPQLVGHINSELAKMIKNDGFMSISEAVGIDALESKKAR